jgi:phage baseplate assembly protein gpV
VPQPRSSGNSPASNPNSTWYKQSWRQDGAFWYSRAAVILTVERSPAAAVLGSAAALVMVLCATTGVELVDVTVRFSSEVKASLLLVTVVPN